MSFICPLCQTPLSQRKTRFCCPGGHHFDKAKEGYVNLLPVQHKRSRNPGDSSEMMKARRNFLDAGHYLRLRECIVQKLQYYLPSSCEAMLDIGCGEGYYTQAFGKEVKARGGITYGLDISRVAIRYAAKRDGISQYCVASSNRLPFSESFFDAVVHIYAPCNSQELMRVVKPGGVIIAVVPGPRHLIQLKAEIYDEVRLHEMRQKQPDGFSSIETVELHYPMALQGNEAIALLQMTPLAWRARPDVWKRLTEVALFTCETDFRIHLWRRD